MAKVPPFHQQSPPEAGPSAAFEPPRRYDWQQLKSLQLGRYAEYFAKMEFTLFGFDVYTAEVDDKGIDFVIRRGRDQHYDVQVKSVTADKGGYIFLPKAKFAATRDDLCDNLLAAVVRWCSSFATSRPSCLSFLRPRGARPTRSLWSGTTSAARAGPSGGSTSRRRDGRCWTNLHSRRWSASSDEVRQRSRSIQWNGHGHLMPV